MPICFQIMGVLVTGLEYGMVEWEIDVAIFGDESLDIVLLALFL